MSKCPNCGADVREGAKFCESCGAKMEVESPRKSFCPQCGAEMPAGAAFCSACGYRVGGAVNAPQAQGGKKPAEETLSGPTGLLRCLLKNIAVLSAFVFVFLSFVVPIIQGGSGSYFNSLKDFANSVSGSSSTPEGLSIFPYAIIMIIYFLPALGIVIFGTISLIDAILGIVKRRLPKYQYAGYMFAFAMPLHIVVSNIMDMFSSSNDFIGFSFLMFKSPSFIMIFIGLIAYLGVGVADNYLGAISGKKSMSPAILRTVAAGVGMFFIICFFAKTVASYQNKQCNNPFTYFLVGTMMIGSYTDSTKAAMGLVPILYGTLYLMAAVFAVMGLADLFRNDGRKGFKVNGIVFVAISSVFGILAHAMICIVEEVQFNLVLPSISGFLLLAGVIAYAVLADAAVNKEKAQ